LPRQAEAEGMGVGVGVTWRFETRQDESVQPHVHLHIHNQILFFRRSLPSPSVLLLSALPSLAPRARYGREQDSGTLTTAEDPARDRWKIRFLGSVDVTARSLYDNFDCCPRSALRPSSCTEFVRLHRMWFSHSLPNG
jgi:hypothetical protein